MSIVTIIVMWCLSKTEMFLIVLPAKSRYFDKASLVSYSKLNRYVNKFSFVFMSRFHGPCQVPSTS